MVGAVKGKPWIIAVAALATLLLFYLAVPADNPYVPSLSSLRKPRPQPADHYAYEQPVNGTTWEFVSERDERNLGLTEEQCQVCLASIDNSLISLTTLRLPSPNNMPKSNEPGSSTKPKAA